MLAYSGIATIVESETPAVVVEWLFIGGVVASALISLRQVLRRHEIGKLSTALARAEQELQGAADELTVVQEALDEARNQVIHTSKALLKWISERHELRVEDRISLYVVADQGALIIGRHSQDGHYDHIAPTTRDKSYGMNHGLVGKVCRTKQRESATVGPPPESMVDYCHWQRKSGALARTQATSLKMKSRTYEVLPVFSAPRGTEMVGVVAIESTAPERQVVIDLAKLIEAGDALVCGILNELIALDKTTRLSPAMAGGMAS